MLPSFIGICASGSGGGCPAAGTYNSTAIGVTYPVAEGGAYVTIGGNDYATQTCDVDLMNDGSCGTYTDWSTATNVSYLPNGALIVRRNDAGTEDPVQIPSDPWGSNFDSKFYTQTDYFSDGAGGYTSQPYNSQYYGNGTTAADLQVDYSYVPSSGPNYFVNGILKTYYWDGTGGFYLNNTNGSYYANGTDTGLTGIDTPNQSEVPSGSSNYFNNGTFTGYTWDGSGGYNYPVQKGSYYAGGTDTGLTGLDTDNQTEVPTGSSTYFNNGTKTGYEWDGTGYYNYPVQKGSYYSNGTFIYNDGTYDYYWNGSGGYYT